MTAATSLTSRALAGRVPAVDRTGRAALEAALLAAHARGDRTALIGLYADASEAAHTCEAAFFLTQAYVFALEAGDPRAPVLKARLVGLGADVPDAP